MIKTLLLIGALTFTPMANEEVPTEPPTSETEPTEGETETTPTEEEEKKEEDTSGEADKKEETTTTEETKKEDFDLKTWLEKFLEPQQVAMIMTWITYAATIIGVLYKFYQMAKEKNLTAENVKNLIMKELGDKVDDSVKNQLASSITSVAKTVERQNEVLALLTKIMALSQENTPESRVAILDLISRLGVVDKEDLDNAKASIENEVAEKKALEEETNNTVDKIIEEHKEEDNGTSI